MNMKNSRTVVLSEETSENVMAILWKVYCRIKDEENQQNEKVK